MGSVQIELRSNKNQNPNLSLIRNPNPNPKERASGFHLRRLTGFAPAVGSREGAPWDRHH
jgi:hypothetical protein